MNLGSSIRKYRKGKRLTLKTVAERAGISEGFLSQVENSVSSPSVDTLMNVCAAIGINAGDLLNRVEKQEKLVVIRRSDWEDVDFPHSGFVTRRFFAPETRTIVDSAVLIVEKGKSIPVRKNIRNGQEVLCLLKGTLELLSGDQTIHMSEGDSVHFWSNPEKQRIANDGEGFAVALWVGTL